jgi:hypothetical protein
MRVKGARRFYIAAFLVASLAAALPTASHAKCQVFNGTADGWNKEEGAGAAIGALNAAIEQWKAANAAGGQVKVTPEKPEPHPYWRSTVSPDLFLTPDIVTDTTYTTCWKGVVSKVVCTSGAKVCG